MKRVVSVSLGSPEGDYERDVTIGRETVHIRREGMNGDMDRARARVRELDGQVDMIGLGGIDIHLQVAGDKYVIGDGLRLAQEANSTPVVDGSGLKDTLERKAVRRLASQGLVAPGSRVLMVSALDRFGMAEALIQEGCHCLFGDLMFNMGIDYPLTQLAELADLARKYRSRLLTVPFRLLYPTGREQEDQIPDPRFEHYYQEAHVVAGDRHLILRHMPRRMPHKGILTNTTRPSTMQRFRQAGVRWIATTTPDLQGISGGTNVMEAALLAAMSARPEEAAPADYARWLDEVGWQGELHCADGL